MKFNVTADLDWVSGHARCHLEGIVNVDSEEELKALIGSGAIDDCIEAVVDDFEVDIFASPTNYEWRALNNNEL